MKKAKKYVYPFIFSIGFIVFWIALGLIINATTSSEGYGGLGLAILILFAWLIVVLPIYCIRYSKIIMDEKLRFLFPFLLFNIFSLLFSNWEDGLFVAKFDIICYNSFGIR